MLLVTVEHVDTCAMFFVVSCPHDTSQTRCVKYVRRSLPSVLQHQVAQVKGHVHLIYRIFIQLAVAQATILLRLKIC